LYINNENKLRKTCGNGEIVYWIYCEWWCVWGSDNSFVFDFVIVKFIYINFPSK